MYKPKAILSYCRSFFHAKMKGAAFAICCLLMCVSAQAHIMRISCTDGSSIAITIEEKSSITFQADRLLYSDFSEDVSSIKSITFGDSSRVSSPSDISISIRSSSILLKGHNISAGDIFISDIDARIIPVKIDLPTPDIYLIQLDELPAGIYILSIKGVGLKFMKR